MAKRIFFDYLTTGAGAETVFDTSVNVLANKSNLKFVHLEGAEGLCFVNFDGSAATLDGTTNYFMGIGDEYETPATGQVGENIPKISMIRSGSLNVRVRGFGYV